MLDSVCTWGNKEYFENGFHPLKCGVNRTYDYLPNLYKENGDYSNMIFLGYWQSQPGEIYYENESSYLDCEYYRDEIPDSKKFLKALSDFFKGNISIDNLLEFQRYCISKSNFE